MSGPDRIVPTNYPTFARVARAATVGLGELGVEHRGTRFERYVAYLTEVTRRSYPRAVRWQEDPGLVYELEAIGQSIQLAAAVALRKEVGRVELVRRLTKVVRGPEVPDPAVPDDHPRNILLELTAAFVLARQGHDIELTPEGEDLILRVPGAPMLAVECKRPISKRSIRTSVEKARRQLFERRRRFPDGGVVVIGVDRVVGMSGGLPRVEQQATIPAVVKDALRDCATIAIREGGLKLAKVAPVVMTLMAGVVFSVDPTRPTAILRTGWTPVPGARQALVDALTAEFTPGPGPPLDRILDDLERGVFA